MLMRKLLTAALSVLLVTFALTPTALATEETSATPESDVSIQYVYINQASTSLTISASGTATVYGYVQKHRPVKTFTLRLLCSVILTDHGQMLKAGLNLHHLRQHPYWKHTRYPVELTGLRHITMYLAMADMSRMRFSARL